MLGDIGGAEDMVQEAFVRFTAEPRPDIDDERAWLTVVTSRLCLDYLRSARVRRESVVLPDAADTVPVHSRPSLDPADRVTLDDAVNRALSTALQQLSPGERVAFVLHDVFSVPFDTISEMTGRPAATCRQLARRARAKVAGTDIESTQHLDAQHQPVIDQFLMACAGGDLLALASVLDPSVWGVGTILIDPAPAPQVNHGRTDVAANLMRYLGPGATLVNVPGTPALLAFAERRIFAVVTLTMRHGLILKIEATADPAARFG